MAIDRASLLLKVCFGLYFFFLGVEYAVILPTINDYLISLDGDNTFLGIVLAAFSFAGLVTAPIYGRITDKTGSAKACIIVGNILEIIGNFMYFVGKSKYFVLGGRILAGLGSGAMSSVMGTLSRATTEKERTSSFALLLMLRQLGLIMGPGFNAFLYKLNFSLGPFDVNADTSPGFFMAILWTLSTVLFIFLYKDKPTMQRQNGEEERDSSLQNDDSSDSSLEVHFTSSSISEFFREEIVLLLAASFFSPLAQTGIESALTPMTLMYFDWHGLSNSFLLLGAGFVVILGFASVHFMSKRFADRLLMLGGCIGLAIGYGVFLIAELELCFNWDGIETPEWLLPVFAADLFVWVMGLCFVFIPNISLYSKLTRKETQAFNQGVRIVMNRSGMILGPLWASPMVTKHRLPVMAGVNFGLTLMLTLMVLGSYKYLLPPPQIDDDDSSASDGPTESSPLLNEATPQNKT